MLQDISPISTTIPCRFFLHLPGIWSWLTPKAAFWPGGRRSCSSCPPSASVPTSLAGPTPSPLTTSATTCPRRYPRFRRFPPVSNYRANGPRETAFACAVGESLSRWYAGNRFCGACGTPWHTARWSEPWFAQPAAVPYTPKSARRSSSLFATTTNCFSPSTPGAARRYALVAGFNEIGETIEQTVQREVLEETGLLVHHLRFYKSQPWVVSDSLLFGFFADLAGPDVIRLQEDELAEARWFPRAELPTDHSTDSLTGEMIEAFRDLINNECIARSSARAGGFRPHDQAAARHRRRKNPPNA